MQTSEIQLYLTLVEVRRRSIKKLEAELSACKLEHQRRLQHEAHCRSAHAASSDALSAYRTGTAERTRSGKSVRLSDLVSARAHEASLEEKMLAALARCDEAGKAAQEQEERCVAAAAALAAAEQRLQNLDEKVSELRKHAVAAQEDLQEEESAEQFAARLVKSRSATSASAQRLS